MSRRRCVAHAVKDDLREIDSQLSQWLLLMPQSVKYILAVPQSESRVVGWSFFYFVQFDYRYLSSGPFGLILGAFESDLERSGRDCVRFSHR